MLGQTASNNHPKQRSSKDAREYDASGYDGSHVSAGISVLISNSISPKDLQPQGFWRGFGPRCPSLRQHGSWPAPENSAEMR